jgi:flagella basal body P-ring formation protein FlgA
MNTPELVRKLTRSRRQRQKSVSDGRAVLRRCFLIVFSFVYTAAAPAAPKWHAVTEMRAVAEAFVEKRLSPSAGQSVVNASQLDERLKLNQCSVPLEAFLRSGTRIGPKTMVGVRCQGAQPWKIYVPVEVMVRRQLWVARHALPRGHLLSESDLVAESRDVARMTTAYVSEKEVLLGKRLTTSILAGRVLTRQMIKADNIVQRGQTVTLSVASGGLRIHMSGKAMTDGALNERIRVENLTSGRIVEGIVRSREIVEVLVPGGLSAKVQSP